MCPPGHVCLFLPGLFHEATEQNPTAIHDVAIPDGEQFSVVEVEVDVTFGGWYPDDPAGLHNIFWLHRGQNANFTWMGGVIGYVNARGPTSNILRTRHDLDVTDLADSKSFNVGGLSLDQGHKYRVFYRYDAAGGSVHVELRDGEVVLLEGDDVPTTNVVTIADGGVFIYFGNGTDVDQPGPEVPSLGWLFSDLRLELIP